jgi:hypothetical protein
MTPDTRRASQNRNRSTKVPAAVLLQEHLVVREEQSNYDCNSEYNTPRLSTFNPSCSARFTPLLALKIVTGRGDALLLIVTGQGMASYYVTVMQSRARLSCAINVVGMGTLPSPRPSSRDWRR